MVAHDGVAEPGVVAGWSSALEDLHGRIAHRFARSEARERARRYLRGLLQRVDRKNGWQLAEALGEADPQGVQRLLNSARWDAEEVRDDLREYVVEHLGDTANSQVGVFLAYASNKGAAFIDRALYLPPAWADDKDRRLEAGVPQQVGFATKVELAR